MNNQPDKATLLSVINDARLSAAKNVLLKINDGKIPTSHEAKLLEEIRSELEDPAQLEQKSGASPSAPAEFKNPLAVAIWLKEAGWAIAKSRVYGHIKEGKLLADLPGGRYSIQAVSKYASLHLKRSRTRQKLKDEDNHRRKLEADIRKTEAEARRAELKLSVERGKYVLMEDVERMLAGRAVLLDTSLQASILNHAAERVSLVGGDPARVPDLIQMDMTHHADTMNAFASWEEFRAILPANAEEKGATRGGAERAEG
jgi:hypothetical protein